MFEKQEQVMLGHMTASEIVRWVREGNGFVVKLHSYIQKKRSKLKIYNLEYYRYSKKTSDTHVLHDYTIFEDRVT